MSKVLKWLEEESDRLTEECHSNSDPYKTVNNSFLEGFNYALANVQGLEQPQLNENQQIVLEWLKLQAPTAKPMQVIFWMMNNAAWGKLDELRKPIMHLTDKQQAQVLEEFGKWAQEQEEDL